MPSLWVHSAPGLKSAASLGLRNAGRKENEAREGRTPWLELWVPGRPPRTLDLRAWQQLLCLPTGHAAGPAALAPLPEFSQTRASVCSNWDCQLPELHGCILPETCSRSDAVLPGRWCTNTQLAVSAGTAWVAAQRDRSAVCTCPRVLRHLRPGFDCSCTHASQSLVCITVACRAGYAGHWASTSQVQ